MKNLLILVALAGVAFLAFHLVTTGGSEQEQAVNDLAERFAAARTEFSQAHRAAGMSGIDTSSGAEAARREVESVRRELTALQEKLTEDAARKRAAGLKGEIDRFLSDL